MKAVFIDTSFLVALVNPKDNLHKKAQEQARKLIKSELYITEEVLTEFLNFFSGQGTSLRSAAVKIIETLSQNDKVIILPQSRESFARGFVLYKSRPDKSYSATDCISMESMKQNKLTIALTSDEHFQQEGFKALLIDT